MKSNCDIYQIQTAQNMKKNRISQFYWSSYSVVHYLSHQWSFISWIGVGVSQSASRQVNHTRTDVSRQLR